MLTDPTHQGCCPLYDPCARHIAPATTSAMAPHALQVDGADSDFLNRELDARKISRRNVMKLAGGYGAATILAAGSAQTVLASAASAIPVFDPRRVGKTHTLPSNALRLSWKTRYWI